MIVMIFSGPCVLPFLPLCLPPDSLPVSQG